MITGSFYNYDFKDMMESVFDKAKKKYNLSLLSQVRSIQYIYSNGSCGVCIMITDLQYLKWNFHNPLRVDKFTYEPDYYIEFILGKPRPRFVFSKDTVDLERMIKGYLMNFNRELVDYMEVPMSGDFSWHDSYVSKLKQRNRYINFSFSTKNFHSEERRIISRMYIRQEAGWEDAISSYFEKYYPDGGKEFDS